ncbi:MAG: DUF1615 domain-containing protein [Piscinibacter sp.]|uniref:DUF1615 domain-containing protein n=1 Tax=Piscinibacter sp. TaxID=1903157 RepID=UPI002585FACC|nr:DUF1615 domain-containing protein [Piscinibacter sp.]MCW5665346.1 DUF1615 domain-containing protein [Piscinibacter sp.]
MSIDLPRAGPAALLAAALLTGCALPGRVAEPQGLGPTEAREAVLRVLPATLDDRAGWAADVHAALAAQAIPSTPENLCAVLAVTEQESGYRADPTVPGLGRIARQEIERRADEAGVPQLALRGALALGSPDGRSYAERIEQAKTERQLSEAFEDFIGMVPLGRTFLASRNPVRTGGPMQVSIAFAEAQAKERPYPYPLKDSVRHEVFTRRGGLYFGAAHLLGYEAPYDRPLYRFADFNAGRWASRNAGFQNALAVASGLPVAPDGDLLPRAGSTAGETERAALSLAGRLGLGEAAIRRDLERGDGPGFEQTTLYERVFDYAEKLDRRALPRAVLPRIDLKSPKFTRRLTTEWFARRVDERHQRCLTRLGPGLSPRPSDG